MNETKKRGNANLPALILLAVLLMFWQAAAMGWAGDHSHTVQTHGTSNDHAHGIWNQGGGAAHENRMPYLAVYFWQRTA